MHVVKAFAIILKVFNHDLEYKESFLMVRELRLKV